MENLNLTNEWDKIFPQSDKVEHLKVTFHNRYGITLAADMYKPKGTEGPYAAIAVCGPYGADHTDLYDNLEKIPFDRIDGFFKTNLTE